MGVRSVARRCPVLRPADQEVPRPRRLLAACMPPPFAPRHDVLSAALDTPTLALQCIAAVVRARPLWQLPVSLVIAVTQAFWGTALMPATLLLGSAQVRCTYATLHSTLQFAVAWQPCGCSSSEASLEEAALPCTTCGVWSLVL
jgi:hypothetical protein